MAPQETAPLGQDWLPEAIRAWPAWAEAAAILAASVGAAVVVTWVIERILKRWAARTRSSIDDRVIAFLHRPLIWTVVLGGVYLCVLRFQWQSSTEAFLARALGSIVALFWAIFLLRSVGLLLRSAAEQPRFTAVEARTLPIFENVAKLAVVAALIWALISFWEVHPGPWIASAGIVGIAVGFAAQDTLSNFFAGIAIIADQPYQVGDYVNLAEGHRGRVVTIGLRSTRILTRDDVEITIPNAVIGGAAIVNETRGPSTANRVRVQTGVAYGTDLDRAQAVLIEVAAGEPLVLGEPSPRVRFRRFGDSGIDLELLAWIELPESRGLVLHRLGCEIYRRFAKEGIEIPYPKRDLYVKQMPGADSPAE
jgi:small-conductance mechanosensitive channel